MDRNSNRTKPVLVVLLFWPISSPTLPTKKTKFSSLFVHRPNFYLMMEKNEEQKQTAEQSNQT